MKMIISDFDDTFNNNKENNISYFFCNKDIRMSQKILDKTVKINID